MRHSILNAIFLVLAALPAAAAPILTVAPSSIELSPTQTVLALEVDPNGTPVSTLLFNLSSLATGIEIVNILSAEPGIISALLSRPRYELHRWHTHGGGLHAGQPARPERGVHGCVLQHDSDRPNGRGGGGGSRAGNGGSLLVGAARSGRSSPPAAPHVHQGVQQPLIDSVTKEATTNARGDVVAIGESIELLPTRA
jgi:hypothetical protein